MSVKLFDTIKKIGSAPIMIMISCIGALFFFANFALLWPVSTFICEVWEGLEAIYIYLVMFVLSLAGMGKYWIEYQFDVNYVDFDPDDPDDPMKSVMERLTMREESTKKLFNMIVNYGQLFIGTLIVAGAAWNILDGTMTPDKNLFVRIFFYLGCMVLGVGIDKVIGSVATITFASMKMEEELEGNG